MSPGSTLEEVREDFLATFLAVSSEEEEEEEEDDTSEARSIMSKGSPLILEECEFTQ